MLNEKKVSIVVPIYNGEKYLDRCINSILNQKYKNWELLLVNDGSVDKSAEICKRYSDIYENIFLICQSNLGVSAARNNGIVHSSGELICFIDCDDSIENNYLSDTVFKFRDLRIDLVWFGMNYISDSYSSFQPIDLNCRIFENQSERIKFILNTYLDVQILFSPCNKVYRTSTIKCNNIFFDTKLSIGEDLFFNLEYLLISNGGYGISQCLYNYYDNCGSAMNRSKNRSFLNDYLCALKGFESKWNSVLNWKAKNSIYIRILDDQLKINGATGMKELHPLENGIRKYYKKKAFFFVFNPLLLWRCFFRSRAKGRIYWMKVWKQQCMVVLGR